MGQCFLLQAACYQLYQLLKNTSFICRRDATCRAPCAYENYCAWCMRLPCITTDLHMNMNAFTNVKFLCHCVMYSPACSGILAYRTLPLGKEMNKKVHNAWMFLAVILVSLGLWAVFKASAALLLSPNKPCTTTICSRDHVFANSDFSRTVTVKTNAYECGTQRQ